MGWGFRKAFRIGRFGRITIGKKSVGGSIGFGPFRIGANSRGSRRGRVTVPGTGLYYEQRNHVTHPGKRKRGKFGMATYIVLASIILLVLLRWHHL